MQIMSSTACRASLSGLIGEINACYTLWDINTGFPVYVGTAKTAARLRVHLKKDEPSREQTKHLQDNVAFHQYVKKQKSGWLGVSSTFHTDAPQATLSERALILEYGIRHQGGQLFNRRMSG